MTHALADRHERTSRGANIWMLVVTLTALLFLAAGIRYGLMHGWTTFPCLVLLGGGLIVAVATLLTEAGADAWYTLLAALARTARALAFVVLLMLRPVVLIAGRVLAPLCFVCGVAYGFLRGWSSLPCLVLLGTSLAITGASFAFDLVLARIGPDGLDLYS